MSNVSRLGVVTLGLVDAIQYKLSAFSELSYLPVLSVPEGSQLDEIRRVGSAESPIKRIGRLEPNGELFSVCFF
jgi:hypothetical protein